MEHAGQFIVWAILAAAWLSMLAFLFVPVLWRLGGDLLLASRRRRWARIHRPGFPVVMKDADE